MAAFRISQGVSVGTADRSRVDLSPGAVIELSVVSPDPGGTYTWELIDVVNSQAALSDTTGEEVTIGSVGGDIGELCTFLVQLTANVGGTISVSRRLAAVPHGASDLRAPTFGESAPRSQTLDENDPDLSVDNASYSDLSGRGVSGQNPFGWREWAWVVVRTLAQNVDDLEDLNDVVTALGDDVEALQEAVTELQEGGGGASFIIDETFGASAGNSFKTFDEFYTFYSSGGISTKAMADVLVRGSVDVTEVYDFWGVRFTGAVGAGGVQPVLNFQSGGQIRSSYARYTGLALDWDGQPGISFPNLVGARLELSHCGFQPDDTEPLIQVPNGGQVLAFFEYLGELDLPLMGIGEAAVGYTTFGNNVSVSDTSIFGDGALLYRSTSASSALPAEFPAVLGGQSRLNVTQARNILVQANSNPVLGDDVQEALERRRAFSGGVVWRAGTLTGDAGYNVYGSAADAFTAISDLEGVVTLQLEKGPSSDFGVSAGTYNLLCNELRIIGSDAEQLYFLNNAVIVGPNLKRIRIEHCEFQVRSQSAALLSGIPGPLYVDLYDGGALVSHNSSTAPMASIEIGAIVSMYGANCRFQAFGYELFQAEDNTGVYLYMDKYAQVTGNLVRSSGAGDDNGAFIVVYSSLETQGPPTEQLNCANYTIQDLLTFSPFYERVNNHLAPPQSSAGAPHTWTSEVELVVSDDSQKTTIILDATTTDWVIGEGRYVYVNNPGGFGIEFIVGTDHYLNGIQNGTSGTIGNDAYAATKPMFVAFVKRIGEEYWLWWQVGEDRSTQIITAYPATIYAKLVALDDDTTGTVTLPKITAGAYHEIYTNYDGVDVTLVPDPTDAGLGVQINGDTDFLINTTYIRSQTLKVRAIEFEGDLGWVIDGTAALLTQNIVPTVIDTVGRVEALENTVTLIWRPTATTTPEESVYGTLADLLAAAATVRGHLKILLDPSLSTTFTAVAAAYPLLCNELTIQAARPNTTVTFPTGVTFTGDTISVFRKHDCNLAWNGTSANGLLGAINRSFVYYAVGMGNMTGSTNSGPMFDLNDHSIIDLRGAGPNTFGGAVELFDIASSKTAYVWLGDRQTLTNSGFIGGAGNVDYTYRASTTTAAISQPNVLGTSTYRDLDGSTQTIPAATSSATINADTGTVIIDSTVSLTLALTSMKVGQKVRIVRRAAAVTFLYFTGGGSDSINGQSFSGTSWALPFCAVAQPSGQQQIWEVSKPDTNQFACVYLGYEGVGLLPATDTGLVGAYNFDGTFNDSSGNGNNLSSIATAPLYEGDYAKGRQAIFIGAGALSSTAAGMRGIANEYYELVIDGHAGAAVQWFHSTDALGTRKSYFGINSGFAFFGFDDTGGTLRDVVSPRVVRGTGLYLIQAKRVVSGGNSTLTIWENGVQTVTGVKTSQTPNNSGSNNTFYIGQNSSATERLGSSTRPARVSQYRVWQGTVPSDAEIVNRARAIGMFAPNLW